MGNVYLKIPCMTILMAACSILKAAQPDTSAAPVTVDKITADVGCRDLYITALAHLYGTILDDFCIINVKNGNSAPVKVVVTTEVTGYTTVATSTVTVAGGASEEIRENPRLTTTAIDGLNSGHDADVHIVVSYLQEGQPRTVLDQTGSTNVTSRRDFPENLSGASRSSLLSTILRWRD